MGGGGSHKPDTLTYYGGCITGGQHVMACSMVTASESGIATDYHMSLQKLDPSDGSATWWIRAVASESDGFQLMDVQVDSSGNLYAVGWGKVGSDNKQSLWCGKFNSSGTKQWNFALGLADDSIAFIPGPLDIDNSDNVYFTGYYNTYVDGSNYTKAVVMKVAGGALPTAGTTGIWKITDTDFAFGLEDFTIEFWVRAGDIWGSTNGAAFAMSTSQGAAGWSVMNNSDYLYFTTQGDAYGSAPTSSNKIMFLLSVSPSIIFFVPYVFCSFLKSNNGISNL